MLGRALSYLVLFSTLGIIVRWSIGVRLVSSAEEGVELQGDEGERDEDMRAMEEAESEEDSTLRPESSEEDVNNGNGLKPKRSILKDTSSNHQRTESSTSNSTPAKFVLLNETEPEQHQQHATIDPTATRPGQTLRREPSLRKKKGRIFQSFPNTPAHSTYGGSRASSVHGGDYDDEDEEELTGIQKFQRGFKRKVWKPLKKFGKGLNDFVSIAEIYSIRRNYTDRQSCGKLQMTVPLWAALLSLVVACIPPLQHTLNQAEPLKACVSKTDQFLSLGTDLLQLIVQCH